MPAFEIRTLFLSDRAGWEVLWQGYLTFYEAKLDTEVTETTWRRLMENGRDPRGLAAVAPDGALIGICHYLFHASTWTKGPYCYLQDLFVTGGARGGGVGRALMEAVFEAARHEGASQTYWLTQEFNHNARELYDRIGDVTPFIKYKVT